MVGTTVRSATLVGGAVVLVVLVGASVGLEVVVVGGMVGAMTVVLGPVGISFATSPRVERPDAPYVDTIITTTAASAVIFLISSTLARASFLKGLKSAVIYCQSGRNETGTVRDSAPVALVHELHRQSKPRGKRSRGAPPTPKRMRIIEIEWDFVERRATGHTVYAR
jgi:hypothetical protein